ncbi:hypothetical protein RhiirA4_466761 [Rhizophagus irregularis]|uniref:F-box domain-containing protein n=1 Tax=Rhizophagus irregularis TaxID=588596 RepID=A0A2I1GUJ9_9GLOM|nr:hypothetical protein RhiirA4_466761 [Rhizophagus irregularis]
MENKDIIYLVLKDLKYDKISLYSCLLINRTWCKMTVPILWNNPIKLLDLFPKARSYKLNILFNFLETYEFIFIRIHDKKSFQKNLREVDFTYYPIDSSNPEIVEESLIKCSNTIQYDDGSLLQAIYQNCPNLSYLKLTLIDRNISEFENVLINCQYLMGLVIREYYDSCYSKGKEYIRSLTSFLDNWKDRHSILLHAYSARGDPKNQKLKDLLQSYKVKGIIKKL